MTEPQIHTTDPSTERPSLAVIGLDGCDWTLVRPWMDAGELPVLDSIRRNGASGNMISTIPPLTAPALASFMTGMNPDNTGVTGFTNRQGALVSFEDIHDPAIWDYLGGAGIRSCIVGLRLTYPPRDIQGILVSGGLMRARGQEFVKPSDHARLCAGFDPDEKAYPALHRTLTTGRVKDPAALTDDVIRLTEKQFSIFLSLRRTEAFPFSLFYLENTDLLQHFAWHRPDLILRLYRRVDTLIGEFREKNPDVNLILMSDHGFHAVARQEFFLNSWLAREGYLKANHTDDGDDSPVRRVKRFLSKSLSAQRRRQIRLFVEKLTGRGNRARQAPNRPLFPPKPIVARRFDFDPASTVAYASETWGIVVEDRGRREALIESLENLKDDQGEKVFSTVLGKEELYRGRYLVQMPDILLIANRRYVIERMACGRLFGPHHPPPGISGAHDQARCGIVMVQGQGVDPSARIEDFRIVDFLPTILGYFGIAAPPGIDGRSHASLFGSGLESRQPIVPTGAGPQDGSSSYTSREEAEVVKRLEHLGYL